LNLSNGNQNLDSINTENVYLLTSYLDSIKFSNVAYQHLIHKIRANFEKEKIPTLKDTIHITEKIFETKTFLRNESDVIKTQSKFNGMFTELRRNLDKIK
jgi:hypothetical protein